MSRGTSINFRILADYRHLGDVFSLGKTQRLLENKFNYLKDGIAFISAGCRHLDDMYRLGTTW